MTPAFPLQWPDAMPRTVHRQDSRFKSTLDRSLAEMRSSLRLFGQDTGKPIKDSTVVISSNYTLGVTSPGDPGVAVYFEWDDAQRCIAVDRYRKLSDNVLAIAKILDARRVEARHGGLSIVRQTFRGFLALPNPDAADWRKLFGFRVDQVVTPAAIDAAYRDKAAALHPDKGKDADERDTLTRAMADLNVARDRAKAEVQG